MQFCCKYIYRYVHVQVVAGTYEHILSSDDGAVCGCRARVVACFLRTSPSGDMFWIGKYPFGLPSGPSFHAMNISSPLFFKQRKVLRING